MFFDFHMHSVYSDGSETPESIFSIADKIGLEAIALTDHDTILGLNEFNRLSQETGIPFVPGIEFTAIEDGMKFHVLGYGVDYESPELIDYSERVLAELNAKSQKQIKLIQESGVDIPEAEFFAEGQGGPLYRAKMLNVLAKHGYLDAADIMQRIKPLFGKNGPFYVPDDANYYDLKTVYELCHRNDGILIFAHPGKVKRKNPDLYYKILDSDLIDGVEIYHLDNNAEVREELHEIAEKRNWPFTGGSDFHGRYNKRGTQIGEVKIPDAVYGYLKPYLKNVS